MTGIYALIVNEKFAYVGQSINIEKRLSSHMRHLSENRHSCFNEKTMKENIKNFKSIVLKECDKDELNEYEYKMYEEMSKKYKMVNKKKCGIQGHRVEKVIFKEGCNPDLELINGDFYIDNIKIEKSDDGLFCLTDLVKYINNNSNIDIRINEVLNTNDFIDYMNALYKIKIPKERRTSEYMKAFGLYKVIGTRENRKIFCKPGILITFAYKTCPQIAASVVILITEISFGMRNDKLDFI